MQDDPRFDRDSSVSVAEPTAFEEEETAVFVLRYDEELVFLVSEGLIRPGMQPSGLKDR